MSTIKSSDENLTLNADGANNDIKFQSNGSEVASIDQAGVLAAGGASIDGAVTINESGADVDFRVESDTNANSIFVQGSNGAVGLGVSSIGTNDALHIENGESYLVMKDAQQMGIKLYGDDTNVIFSYDKTANSITGGVTWAHADGATDFYTGGLNSRMKINATGAVTMPAQPAFHASSTANQNSLSIGSEVTVVWGGERFDLGNNFASNTFTAPVTGKYSLTVNLRVDDIDSAANWYSCRIRTSNKDYYSLQDPDTGADVNYWHLSLTILADMDANDTADVAIVQEGGTAQSDIDGDGKYTNFSGYLVC